MFTARLQTLASICSTFVLQTLGVPAFRQGNLINIPGLEHPFNCRRLQRPANGSRFSVRLAVAMVFLIERPWWDKFVILLSAIPIALVVNIVRITVTGLLYMVVGQDNQFVHETWRTTGPAIS